MQVRLKVRPHHPILRVRVHLLPSPHLLRAPRLPVPVLLIPLLPAIPSVIPRLNIL